MPGQIVHLEIPASDTAKAREFWGSLFGWEWQAFEGSPREYHMTQFSDTQGGAIYEPEQAGARGTRAYFGVDDIAPAWAGSRSARTRRGTTSGCGRPTRARRCRSRRRYRRGRGDVERRLHVAFSSAI